MPARAFEDMDELPPGTSLLGGRIAIDIRIGRGGAATVYAATMADGRQVALKIMSGEHADNTTSRQRFRNEVALAQHLADHPRVVTPYEMGEFAELGGRPYITMPLVKGRSLVLLRGRLELLEAVALMRDLAQTVADLHSRGIIHRDIKPANVIVQQGDGERIPFLLDFGVAYSRGDGSAPATAGLTAAHELPGTKHYMAPEQITGDAPDVGFDVYALGVTMYEVLTGVVPLDDLSPADAARRKCDPNLPSLSIAGRLHGLPDDLEQTVDAALQRDPSQRIRSAADLADRLNVVLQRMRAVGPKRFTAPAPQAIVPFGDETEMVPPQLVAAALHEGRAKRAERAAQIQDRRIESELNTETAPPAPIPHSSEGEHAPAKRWFALAGAVVLLILILGGGLALSRGSTNETDGPAERIAPRTHSMAASGTVERGDEGEALADTAVPDGPGSAPAETGSASTDMRDTTATSDSSAQPSTEPAVEPKSEPKPDASLGRPPKPRPRPCTDVGAEAKAAIRAKQWKHVLALTKSARCWDNRDERLALRMAALLALGRFDACAKLGRTSKAPDVTRVAATCEQQLD